MTRRLSLFLVVPIALLALVAAGCGGSSSSSSGSVPSDAVATVGDQTITKADFDHLLSQAQQSYEQQKRAFPKPGTQQYEQLKQQAVQFLVQRSEFAQKASDMGITISDKQVDDRLNQVKQQYFKGSNAKYEKQLKSQG